MYAGRGGEILVPRLTSCAQREGYRARGASSQRDATVRRAAAVQVDLGGVEAQRGRERGEARSTRCRVTFSWATKMPPRDGTSSEWPDHIPHNRFFPPVVIAAFRSAVQAALVRESDCVPRGTVMFSMLNSKWASIRALSLSRVGSMACLMSRFVSLCLGGFTDEFGTCVDGPPLEQGGSFRDKTYHELTWAVWMLAHAALLEASYALYVDADVVLLTNPFAHLDVPRASMLYAEEVAGCNKAKGHLRPCSSNPCKLNAGLFLVSSTKLTFDILTQVQPKVVGRETPLSQDLIVNWIRSTRRPAANHTFCRLPPTFAGYCSEVLHMTLPRACDRVTFHATCLRNASKEPHMKEALKNSAMCGDRRVQSGNCCRRAGAGSPRIDKMRNVPSSLDCADLCAKRPSCLYHSHSQQYRHCFLCTQCDLYPGTLHARQAVARTCTPPTSHPAPTPRPTQERAGVTGQCPPGGATDG